MQPTRRSIVAGLGTGMGAPLLLGATNKSGSAKPILGEGAHKYEVTHDWGELPPGLKYGNTHGVCEDSQGRIYIHHTVNATSEKHDTMVVFDPKGRFVKSWGAEFEGGAHGLHISKEGANEFLYLCDTKRALVTKTSLDGEKVFTIGYPDQSDAYKPGADGKKPKYSPTNMAIGPNGDLYVGDGYGSSYVNQYNNKGDISGPLAVPARKKGSSPARTASCSTHAAKRRTSRLRTAATSGCSDSHWMGNISISSTICPRPVTLGSSRMATWWYRICSRE